MNAMTHPIKSSTSALANARAFVTSIFLFVLRGIRDAK